MSASATIPPTPLHAEPGAQVSVFVQVRNTGEIVDQYTFEVLGEAANWVELDPPELSLFPGAEGEIKLTFSPPRSTSTPSGEIPFGLKVVSKEDPEDSVVEEGTLEVGTFTDSGAELLPRTSRGRLAGRHELAFDNRGNTRINATLSAADPDNKLNFRFSPPAIVSEPGTATFAKVVARPKKKFFWGRAKTFPFKVFVEPEGDQALAVDGTIYQEQLIPKWTVFLLLGAGLLVLLWAFVLKPSIEDTAKNAAADDNAKQQAQIDKVAKDSSSAAAQKAAAAAKKEAAKAKKALENAKKQLSKAQAAAVAAANAPGNESDGRLQATCGTDCTPSFTVPDKSTLLITDLVLQNPQGDSGLLTILRDGKPILVQRLDNFRDLDFHFITPIIFKAKQKLEVKVECENKKAAEAAGGAATAKDCTPSVYFAGPTKTQKKQTQSGA